MIGNFSQSIAAMTQQLNMTDVGIVDFNSPIVPANSTDSDDSAPAQGFEQYSNKYSDEYRFYLLENQSVLMRKYMSEILNQHNDLMQYVEGIYKNQKLMLYWINDQESRLNNQTGAVAPIDNSTLPADNSTLPADGSDSGSNNIVAGDQVDSGSADASDAGNQ